MFSDSVDLNVLGKLFQSIRSLSEGPMKAAREKETLQDSTMLQVHLAKDSSHSSSVTQSALMCRCMCCIEVKESQYQDCVRGHVWTCSGVLLYSVHRHTRAHADEQLQ